MNTLPPEDKPPRPGSAALPYPPPHLLGERVRQTRVAAHLTQLELAGTTFSKSYISAVEHGKMTPSFQALRILAERLEVTLSFLLGEETKKQSAESPQEQRGVEQQRMLLEEAERLLDLGRYEEALANFESIGQREKLCWAHEQYARFLADQGRYQEAYEQMRLALQRP